MTSANVQDRYQIEERPIGQGGMGVVYKAFDSLTKRFVALKTLKGEVDPACIEMFQKEWSQLAQLSHPNIVDVLDIGDFVQDGHHRPYFVMPLLQGATLDELIKTSGSRLTPERTVDILCQTCRGLQAAHDRGLVHRDLKPSNVFVMTDDTVKIIDFGIVHLVDTQSRTGVKGTLQYMAPEQLEMKPASSRSDIFSLGVVCYEALTGRKPFQRGSEGEVVDAIRTHMPAPVSELNASVNGQVSRAVQKAMAKQPYHRFSSAREFSEILQRSLRNEHIDLFDRNRIQPRINRIKKALTDGDLQLATDMIDEVEAEGHLDPELSVLRIKAEQAARSRAIYQLIESGRTRMEEEEFPLALQNVQRVLDIDPTNADALSMRSQIEKRRGAKHVEKWILLAQQHLDNGLFEKARQAVDEVQKADPSNQTAVDLLSAIGEGEQEAIKIRQVKQQLYESALQGYRKGELSSALSNLQRVIELGKRAPGHPHTEAQYLALYEQVRSEHDELHNSYAEGKQALESRNFSRALEICQEVLQRLPGEPLFQALKVEIENVQRQESSETIARLHNQIEIELDLERKVSILTGAVEQFPDERQFGLSLKLVKERRDMVNAIIERARQYESQRLFSEALNQWDVIRTVYAQYPGLDHELQRLARKQEENDKQEAKAVWLDKIDRALHIRDYGRAAQFLHSALQENPDDSELVRLKQRILTAAQTSKQAHALLAEGEKLSNAGNKVEAIEKLRAARDLDESDPSIRAVLRSLLVEHARSMVDHDWANALPFVEEALKIDSSDPTAAAVLRMVDDKRQGQQIEEYLTRARELQGDRKLKESLKTVEEGLRQFPNEVRLSQLRNTLRAAADVDQNSSAYAATSVFSPSSTANRDKDLPQRESAGEMDPALASQGSYNPVWLKESSGGLRGKIVWGAVAAVAVVGVVAGLRMNGNHNLVPASTQTAAVQAQSLQLEVGRVSDRSSTDGSRHTQTGDASAKVKPQSIKDVGAKGIAGAPPQGPDFTSFALKSDPPGASVTVDGDQGLTCTTPCDFPLLRGTHKLSFSKAGYEPSQRSVHVPEEFSRTEPLTPMSKLVRITSTPVGAEVTIDDEKRGVTPVNVRLSIGAHTLLLSDEEKTIEKQIEVKPETIVFSVAIDSADFESPVAGAKAPPL